MVCKRKRKSALSEWLHLSLVEQGTELGDEAGSLDFYWFSVTFSCTPFSLTKMEDTEATWCWEIKEWIIHFKLELIHAFWSRHCLTSLLREHLLKAKKKKKKKPVSFLGRKGSGGPLAGTSESAACPSQCVSRMIQVGEPGPSLRRVLTDSPSPPSNDTSQIFFRNPEA